MSKTNVDNGMLVLELITRHGSLGPAELSTLKMTNSEVAHFVLGSSRAQKVRMPAQSDPQRAADAAVWMASNGSLLTQLAVDVRWAEECSLVATALHVAAATSFAHAAADAAKERESFTWVVAMGALGAAKKAVRAVRAAAAAAAAAPAVRAEQLAVAKCLAQVATEEAVLAWPLAHDRVETMRDFVVAKELAAEGAHAALQQLAMRLYPNSGLQLVNFSALCAPGTHLILEQLKQCTGLKSLQVQGGATNFSEEHMQAALGEVSFMPSLQQLKLTPLWIHTATPSLAGLTGLTELDLRCLNVGELPMSLQKLKLCGCSAPPSNSRQLQQLEELHLDCWPAGHLPPLLTELVHLKRLTCLNLSWRYMLDDEGQGVALQVGHVLAALTSLKEIHFSQSGDQVSSEAAQQLWRGSGRQLPIVSLDLRVVEVCVGTGPVLADMQRLTSLCLCAGSMAGSELAAAVAALPSLVGLKVVDLDVARDLQGQGAFALLCGAAAQSPSLQTLTLAVLRNLGSAQEGFAKLAAATRLRSLNLTKCQGVCSDAVVQLVASLTQLTQLVLDHNPGLDKAAVLSKVQQLSSLNVLAWDKLLEVDKAELLLHVPGLVFEYDDREYIDEVLLL